LRIQTSINHCFYVNCHQWKKQRVDSTYEEKQIQLLNLNYKKSRTEGNNSVYPFVLEVASGLSMCFLLYAIYLWNYSISMLLFHQILIAHVAKFWLYMFKKYPLVKKTKIIKFYIFFFQNFPCIASHAQIIYQNSGPRYNLKSYSPTLYLLMKSILNTLNMYELDHIQVLTLCIFIKFYDENL